MSQTPIYDELHQLQQAARLAGLIEGRTSMREQVLDILRNATKHPSPAMANAIAKIEKLGLTK